MADAKSNEKAVEHAVWNIPGSMATLTYSLPVFHDIDFVVNEAFRKIPHGGIETGGLLFGTVDPSGTRIEAFREIACEHVLGPSFTLSENDLAALSKQMESCGSDPELEGLKLVGWFLAHTRSSLQLSDRELLLFNRIFPAPGQLTVLVKPERFQATRFGFLVRAADESVPRDAAENAVILPLTGGKSKSAGPVSSIPAPAPIASARKLAEAAAEQREPAENLVRPEPPSRAAPIRRVPEPERLDGEENNLPPARPRRTTGRLNLEQVRLAGERAEREEQDQRKEPTLESWQKEERVYSKALVLTGQRVRPREEEALDPREQIEMLNRVRRDNSAAKLVFVLPLAALLGCIVGYIAYLQVPSPVIPLTVRSLSQTVLVSWPPEQTRNSVYAAVRVDDGTPVLLSPEEKAAGQVEVSAAYDIKVELIARTWLRDSRGIVRYVKAANLRSPMKIP